MEDMGTEGAKRQREAYGQFGDELGYVTDELRGGIGEAVDYERLKQDPEYARSVMAALGETEGGVEGAITAPGLGVSDRYMNKRGWTDAEVDKLAESGARDVGARYQAGVQDLERRTAASGGDQLALAAERERLLGRSAVDMADARVRAELMALERQKSAEQDVESTRLGAEQSRSGLQAGSRLQLGGLRTGALSDVERGRMLAEQGYGGLGLRGADLLAGQRMSAAGAGYSARSGAERDIRNTGMDTERWKTDTGLKYGTDAERETARRAAMLAGNRQGVELGVQNDVYRRGLTRNQLLSDRSRGIADTRIGQGAGARGYFTGQQDYSGSQYNQAMGRRMQGIGMGLGGMQTAAAGRAGAYQSRMGRPSGFQQVGNAAAASGAEYARGAGQQYGWGGQPNTGGGGYRTPPFNPNAGGW
jgi:hypothetical protein